MEEEEEEDEEEMDLGSSDSESEDGQYNSLSTRILMWYSLRTPHILTC